MPMAVISTLKIGRACLILGLGVLLGILSLPASAAAPIHPELAISKEPLVPLEEGWQNPPLMSRTLAWWWWLNGNVTKQAITQDLEAMKAKGLGGANIIDAGGANQRGHRQVPHGPDFATPQWRELFLHAIQEADRLGLELGFNIQSGWNLGGPTVRPEHAAKKLTWSETTTVGGHRVQLQLPRPPIVGGFYRDLAVVAFPMSPAAAQLARIANFRQKAYYEYPGPFTAAKADHLLLVGAASENERQIQAADVVDVSRQLDGDGRLTWVAPEGNWTILRFGYTLSGSRVSTSSEGWNGWAIDYLDPLAFRNYWQEVVKPLLRDAKQYYGRSLKYLHTDSWELGPVNWTPSFPQAFAQRRGYSLTQFLPALAGYVVDDRTTSNRFLNDFRRTLADLIADGKYATFQEHAHELGLGIHPESGGPHAAPIDALMCLGRNDMMMGEFWARSRTHRVNDHERLFTKQASSAAHLYGKRVVLAEAFTSIGPQWERTPQDLKPVFDRVACEGLNLVMLHTFDCSPDAMGSPGQAYFAGTHINRHVTWWNRADVFFDYLNRCQFMLQQGLSVADVLYFYGENVPSFVRLKDDDPANVLPGYDYDVTNAEALTERTSVRDGQITLPEGTSYRVLTLPPGNSYGLRSLEHIASLLEDGATIVGPKPTGPIGLSGNAQYDQDFARLVNRLWDHSTDNASAIRDITAREAIRRLGVDRDFVAESPGDAVADIDFIHRRTSDADIYFVVNRLDRWQDATCSFRVMGLQPELWDPLTGGCGDAQAFWQAKGRTFVPLRFPPNGSRFVVFQRTVSNTARGSGQYNEPRPNAERVITGPWAVEFDERWGGPAEAVSFDTLISWPDHAESGIKYYSGSATYRTKFDLDRESLPQLGGSRWWIDLGQVKNVASVKLNGNELGVAWTDPFRVQVTNHLRLTGNELEIEVTNLWPNRIIGDRCSPDDQPYTRTNIRKFTADSPLLESGLLGPVQLMAEHQDSVSEAEKVDPNPAGSE